MKKPLHYHHASPKVPRALQEDVGLAQIIHPYGVGIDTHSGFIQVCVIWVCDPKHGSREVRREEREFSTEWTQLQAAHTWVLRVLSKIPGIPKPFDPAALRYLWR